MKYTADKSFEAYKGFNADLTCCGYQYTEGKKEVFDGAVRCGEKGSHACRNPLDVLRYYPPAKGSIYRKVECGGEIDEAEDEDSKFACAEITINGELKIADIVKIGIKMIWDKVKKRATSGDFSTSATSGDFSTSATSGYSSTSATSGDFSTSATSGDFSTSATSGYSSTSATSGDFSTSATSGNSSTSATSGYSSTSATSGDFSTSATSGYSSTSATSGYSSTSATSGDFSTSATSGDFSTSATSGDFSVSMASGKCGIAVANGYKAKASAALGNYIVLTEYSRNGVMLCAQMAKVDGDIIKPDTLYMLKKGEFVEATEEEE